MELFYNGNGERRQNNNNKKENPNKSINHVVFYFSLNGYKNNLHEFPLFCTSVYRQTEFDRPRVLRKTDFLVLVQACTSFVVNENLNIF